MAYPQVSIIIPLYNKAPYIKKALESVCAQLFTDWECIIMDDGSTDDSATIAAQWISQQEETIRKRFRLLHQANAGVAAARNNAVEASTGDKIAFLDADDWWDPACLQEMLIFSNQYSDAGIWGCNYYTVKNNKPKVVLEGIATGYIPYYKTYYEQQAMPLWTGAVVLQRHFFEAAERFNPQLRMAEDFDLWVRMAMIAPVAFLNKPLAYYNQDVQVRWRAIGKLYPPTYHFAFQADYLSTHYKQYPYLQQVVEMVQIVCLRQYYLSHTYYQEAREQLKKINIEKYRDSDFAQYLWQPRIKNRLIMSFVHYLNIFRNI